MVRRGSPEFASGRRVGGTLGVQNARVVPTRAGSRLPAQDDGWARDSASEARARQIQRYARGPSDAVCASLRFHGMNEARESRPDAVDGEEAEVVLASAAARGWRLSRSQLERRHRAGVICRPQQRGRGRGKGSLSIYPLGTAALLIEGLELGARMPLRELAFELWLRGRRVPMEGVRAYLMATAALHDRVAAVLRVIGFGRVLLPTRAIRFLERIVRTYASRLPTMRRRLGTEERVETVVRAALDMAAGTYTPPTRIHGPADDEGLLVEIALGLQKARIEAPTGLKPWLTGSMTEIMVDSTRLYAGSWMNDLRAMTDAQLDKGHRPRVSSASDAVSH